MDMYGERIGQSDHTGPIRGIWRSLCVGQEVTNSQPAGCYFTVVDYFCEAEPHTPVSSSSTKLLSSRSPSIKDLTEDCLDILAIRQRTVAVATEHTSLSKEPQSDTKAAGLDDHGHTGHAWIPSDTRASAFGY